MPNNLTWKEKLELTRKSGFDYLEMSVDESDEKLARLDWTQKERDHIKETMIETGVPIRSMCLSAHRKYPLGSREEAIRKRSLEIMEKAIDLAYDLGIRIIQLAGYDVYYETGDETTRKLFEKNLKKSVEMAARKGVVLGFETMETPFMDTVEKA
ncbi:L-ribulose-5-phosphate 3-epimerase, partial [Faecalicoccus pleomorphus]